MDKHIKNGKILTAYVFPFSQALFQTMCTLYSGDTIAICLDNITCAKFVLDDLHIKSLEDLAAQLPGVNDLL